MPADGHDNASTNHADRERNEKMHWLRFAWVQTVNRGERHDKEKREKRAPTYSPGPCFAERKRPDDYPKRLATRALAFAAGGSKL
jgi:hypothetical protein